jgi:hypothetical protein
LADIFGSEQIEPTPDESTITLATLVGEGQKYKSPDELAKAYANADAYIATLKAKEAEREAELKVLRDLAEARQKQTTPPEQIQQPTHEQREPAIPKAEVDISELVRQELSNASETKRRNDNISAAAETMNKFFGSPSKAQEAIRNKASELGVSFDWLKDAAAQSPSAFYATMGISGEPRSNSTPGYQPEVRPTSNNNGQKNFKYFEEIRKSSPKLYHSSEVQKQLFAARRELGDKFYS